MTLPPKLAKGDLVGLLSISSPLDASDLGLVDAAVALLEGWGLRVRLPSPGNPKHGYLADADERRAGDFIDFYSDDQIKALFFTRGGYGAPRIIRLLPDELVARSPKMVVGYSDVTAALLYLQRKGQLVVFHGPHLATRRVHEDSDEGEITRNSLYENLFNGNYRPSYQVAVLKAGQARGELVGGNLTLLSGSIGTLYEPVTDGKILFLEDTNRKPQHLDRLITHLRNAGKFDRIAGLVLADMAGCFDAEGRLLAVLTDLFQHDNFPVVYGLASGHGASCITLPLGLPVEIDSGQGLVRYLPSLPTPSLV